MAADQRRRVVAAVARLCRKEGYRALTVDRIVAAATISRTAFYALFAGKAEAFQATQTVALQGSIAVAAEAFFGAETWPERVWSGLRSLLLHLGDEPDLAWADLVESFDAGPTAVERFFESRMAFTLFLEEGYGLRTGRAELPRLCSEAIGGAILELIRTEMHENGPEGVVRVLPLAAYVAIAPFLGADEAAAFVRGKLAEAGARATVPALADRG